MSKSYRVGAGGGNIGTREGWSERVEGGHKQIDTVFGDKRREQRRREHKGTQAPHEKC